MRLIAETTADRVAVLLGLAILVLSLLPADEIAPGRGHDKIQHFLAYGALAFLAFLGCRRRSQWLVRAGVILALGIAIEFVQPRVGRLFGWTDMAANAVGIAAAAVLVLLVRRSGLDGRIRRALRRPGGANE